MCSLFTTFPLLVLAVSMGCAAGRGRSQVEKAGVAQSPDATRVIKVVLDATWAQSIKHYEVLSVGSAVVAGSGTGPGDCGVPMKGLRESLRPTIRDVASRGPDAGTASKSVVLPRLRPGYAGWRALALWFQNRRPVPWTMVASSVRCPFSACLLNGAPRPVRSANS